MKHQRIMLIGSGGSGKSTLARQLGMATGLPVVHLDQLYWRPGWQHLSNEEFDQALETELAKECWIIDGNFNRTMAARLARCDAVIYLDLPRVVCLLSVIKRVISSYGRTRPDMGEGCPEKFDWEFVKWVWGFSKKYRARYMEMLENAPDKSVYIVRSRREIPGLIARLSTDA